MRAMRLLAALPLLLGGVTSAPSITQAAPWIPGDDTYAAGWVKEIEQELSKAEYQAVFLNDPRTPQASVLRLLNRAAIAQQAEQENLARELAQQAIDVLEEGVQKHYYEQADVKPLIDSLTQRIPMFKQSKGST